MLKVKERKSAIENILIWEWVLVDYSFTRSKLPNSLLKTMLALAGMAFFLLLSKICC